MPLAITRCALLTPLDSPSRSTWDALRAGLRVTHPAVNDALLDPDTTLDRSIRLALAVATRALPPDIENRESRIENPLALFCGTSKGPALTMLRALDTLRRNQPLPQADARHVALGVGAMGALLAERLRLPAAHTSVAACSSGMHALHRAAQAIRRGECARALVVAADASLHPLFEASFARLGVLAPADDRGIRACEPFSRRGQGFFLAEAAAALLLENINPASLTEARVENGKPKIENLLAFLDSSGIAADSTHLIATDAAGDSLRHALHAQDSELKAQHSPLAFIHAHATGTDHDAHELAAIRSVFSDTPVFSHKAWLGHSLGAAGLVSVALSALSHHHAALPDNTPIPPNATSLTLAQGFGGHIALVRLHN
jgi:3-oxoacyl-[acyl-carrier-protein] synthase II